MANGYQYDAGRGGDGRGGLRGRDDDYQGNGHAASAAPRRYKDDDGGYNSRGDGPRSYGRGMGGPSRGGPAGGGRGERPREVRSVNDWRCANL